jgi:hypothetical protein
VRQFNIILIIGQNTAFVIGLIKATNAINEHINHTPYIYKLNKITLKKLGQILLVLILLGYLFDPSLTDIHRIVSHASNWFNGTPDDTENNDTKSFDYTVPQQSTFDSTEILQGIDSIESTERDQQEIIPK